MEGNIPRAQESSNVPSSTYARIIGLFASDDNNAVVVGLYCEDGMVWMEHSKDFEIRMQSTADRPDKEAK